MIAESEFQLQSQLRALGREVERTGERERLAISKGLHDQVGHALVSVRLRLGVLAQSLSPEQAKEVEELREDLRESLDSIRSLIFDLTNPLVYEVGLCLALEGLVHSLQGDHGVRIRYRCEGDLSKYSQESAIVCYRVIKEMLFNVVEHSGAKEASLEVWIENDKLMLEIVDDGLGFEPAEFDNWAGEIRGLGLFQARERVRRLGGRSKIVSGGGQGTTVRIELPMIHELASAKGSL